MKIPPEQKIECPQCSVVAGAYCKGKRGRRMLTTHTRRKQLWKIRNGLATKVKVGGRGTFVVPIHFTHDVCEHCQHPRSAHIAVNNTQTGLTAMSVFVCPTALFRRQASTVTLTKEP